MTDEQTLAAKLASRPHFATLVRPDAATLEALAKAWNAGATEWSESHPVIELLLGDQHARMMDTIERGLRLLPFLSSDADNFRRRVVSAARADYADIAAAITELFVAWRLVLAGASVQFVPTRGSRTPDLEAARDAARVTLEAYGLHLADEAKKEADAQIQAFHGWARGTAVPEAIKGAARQLGESFRVLEQSVRPYGDGTHAERIDRLARKLAKKAHHGQLAARPDAVLVVASWHIFGPSAGDLEPPRHGRATPILRAAVFGRAGDVIRDAEEFEGAPIETWIQGKPGVLSGPTNVKAILWLFHDGSARLLEPLAGGLTEDARALLLEAFGAERVTG